MSRLNKNLKQKRRNKIVIITAILILETAIIATLIGYIFALNEEIDGLRKQLPTPANELVHNLLNKKEKKK